MICSRPEWHFKSMLSRVGCRINCTRQVMQIDDEVAWNDVYHVLCDGFRDIRERYRERLDSHWPEKRQIIELTLTSGGLFIVAVTLLQFIGDRACGNPRKLLDICLQSLRSSGVCAAANPFHTLDILYQQILSNVPDDALPIVLDILMVHLASQFMWFLPQIAAFLQLDRGAFFHALEGLHFVLATTPAGPDDAGSEIYPQRLWFLHQSFHDFLLNPSRSSRFCLKNAQSTFAFRALWWARRYEELYALPKGSICTFSYYG
ncbi:hypothetical protein P691DRAFT_855779 [Macrolepiota fuliginosa MF-IS2]|uniref:Uncharacterized protein n=1 Tax=Macrolepiota fuliginosa MF-IS2 TaxID=1400762 RepID=A0A9P6BXA0_9AGAR|nr:hypothetical protein P691DRAFT_855779 [Macrolepiota fuliginosa MF-IS2]